LRKWERGPGGKEIEWSSLDRQQGLAKETGRKIAREVTDREGPIILG